MRKLAALDLAFHGPRFVLVEFAGAVLLAGGLGVLSLRAGLTGPGRPVAWEIGLAALLVGTAANYLPLLVHAIDLVRSGTARREVVGELAGEGRAARRYGTQQVLLVVPFAVLGLADARARGRRVG